MPRIEPSAHIYRSAKQFHDAAELIWEKTDGADRSYVYPIIVNYALACELALKACESSTSSEPVREGALLPTVEINSTIWGHKLSKLFESLTSDTQLKLDAAFSSVAGVSLQPLLKECENYFIKSRYPWEKDNKCVFYLSRVRKLSSGLIAAVPALGNKIGYPLIGKSMGWLEQIQSAIARACYLDKWSRRSVWNCAKPFC